MADSLKPPRTVSASILTLAVDIGGTGIKAETLNAKGRPTTERSRIPTPPDATPAKVVAIIARLAKAQGRFDRVSVGFPGPIKKGLILGAKNLGDGWTNYDLPKALRAKLGRPVRIANDADVQGMGAIKGRGTELVITLGTGFGSCLFVDGHHSHMELARHPLRKGRTYEGELGRDALEKFGKKKWNKHLLNAIGVLQRTFNYDWLYIGGGNAKSIKVKLPANVKVISNQEGLLGGIKLWEREGA